MAFASFLGRVLFASVFILSAYQELNEYGVDGGPAAKAVRPKFDAFINKVDSQVGFKLPEIDIKYLVAGAIILKGIGGILFIFGSSSGAILLLLHQLIATPILYDFYNYDSEDKEFIQLFIKFTQHMALFGALLFFIGMKNSIPRRQPKKKVPFPKQKPTSYPQFKDSFWKEFLGCSLIIICPFPISLEYGLGDYWFSTNLLVYE